MHTSNLSDINASLESKIKKYCAENNLNFDLLSNMKKLWGIDMLKFVIENNNGEKSNEVVLEVFGYGDNITFEQTEHTRKYLVN